jgi:nucleoside-diphosphate-sugar epimerase
LRVFVAGATGVLGRRVVPLLVEAGHEVSAVARGPEKAAALRAQGATPVAVDLFDGQAVTEAVAGHDAVLNLATSIPMGMKAAQTSAWADNDRIRTEASAHLVDAALAAGARRFVQESIAFTYADGGDGWLSEDAPLDPIPHTRSALVAEAAARRFTQAGAGRVGVALRFAYFYGQVGHTADLLRLTRAGVAPAFGPGTYLPSIHIDDAATAVVAALKAPAGDYNVADDEPLTKAEYFEAVAASIGVRPPRVPPLALARAAGSVARLQARSLRVSNRQFKEATGWAPRYPSAREGWPASIGPADTPEPPGGRVRPPARLLLGALAAVSLIVGAWAQFAPRSFYDSFPGFGRVWVAADGPYNEHLVRDVGGLNLALALLLTVAAVRLSPVLVRTAAAGALVYGAPHLLYHLNHLGLYGTGDRIANEVALALGVAAPVALLVLAFRRSPPRQ